MLSQVLMSATWATLLQKISLWMLREEECSSNFSPRIGDCHIQKRFDFESNRSLPLSNSGYTYAQEAPMQCWKNVWFFNMYLIRIAWIMLLSERWSASCAATSAPGFFGAPLRVALRLNLRSAAPTSAPALGAALQYSAHNSLKHPFQFYGSNHI